MLHHITLRQKIVVMLAVLSGLFLVALDQTIIATALGKIVEEFNSFSSLSWIVTAYLLTSTITVPIAGKLSDIFGRRSVLLVGVGVFVLASFLSGSSQNVEQLIAYRALQGMGGGIIASNAFSIIGDLFAPRERGRWMGLFGGVFGVASVIGPLLGGFLTESHNFFGLTTDWRWTFWINVPIGIISFIIIALYAPSVRQKIKPRIDYIGAALLSLALSTLVLAADNTEKVFASFLEATGISLAALRTAMLLLAAALTILFIIVEKRAKEPIIAPKFFKNRNFVLMMAIAGLVGAAMLGSILYLTQFNQQVFGADPTESGLMLLPLMAGLVIFSTATGQIISKTGRYKILLIIGFGISSIATFALSFLTPETPYIHEAIMMFFTGVGIGVAMPIMSLVVQNEFKQRDLGAVTAASQLFRSLGSTIGVAVFGGLLTAGITANLGNIEKNPYIEQLSQQPQAAKMLKKVDADTALNLNMSDQKFKINKAVNESASQIAKQQLEGRSLPEAMKRQAEGQVSQQIKRDFHEKQADFSTKVVDALTDGLRGVFYGSSALMFSGFVVSFFIRETKLRSGKKDETPIEV